MKTFSLAALLICTLVALGQTKRGKTPADILYGPRPDPATWDGKPHGPVHVGIFNPKISNLEEFVQTIGNIPSKPARTDSGRVEIQLLVNEDGEVIFANPLSGPETLWPYCVKAAVVARFQPMTLERKPVQQEGSRYLRLQKGRALLSDERLFLIVAHSNNFVGPECGARFFQLINGIEG